MSIRSAVLALATATVLLSGCGAATEQQQSSPVATQDRADATPSASTDATPRTVLAIGTAWAHRWCHVAVGMPVADAVKAMGEPGEPFHGTYRWADGDAEASLAVHGSHTLGWDDHGFSFIVVSRHGKVTGYASHTPEMGPAATAKLADLYDCGGDGGRRTVTSAAGVRRTPEAAPASGR